MITSLTTNVKSPSGEPRTFKLYPKTLIVGPSASGKSAITQGVELALSDRLSDYLGRADASLRTISGAVTAAEKPVATVAGAAGGLLYADTLEACLRNPLDAHVALLGALLPPPSVEMVHEVKALERERREATNEAEAAAAVKAWLTPRLGVREEPTWVRPALEEVTGRERAAIERAEGKKGRLDSLRGALRIAVQAAWTEDVLAAVSRFIPKRLGHLRIACGDGAALHFGLGLQRAGEPVRWAPSGSEWNVIVSALACWRAGRFAEITTGPAAGVSGGVQNAALPVIIPADRAIDGPLLREWMQALAKAPAQVLLTAIAAPREPVRGWTVVKVRAC